MSDTRRANVNWTLPDEGTLSFDAAHLAVLMDLRDQLRDLNMKLACSGQIQSTLRRIEDLHRPRKITPKQAARVLGRRANRKRAKR